MAPQEETPVSVTVQPSAPVPPMSLPAHAGSAASPGILASESYAPRPRLSGDRLRRLVRRPVVRGMAFYLLLFVLLGLLAAVVWHSAVRLPVYHVGAEGRTATTERGLTRYFSTDAWFCLLGAVVGLVAGTLAWRWFRRIGWPVVPLALMASLVACLVCWRVGTALGPDDFASRIAAAQPGDDVPIDFRLRSLAALLVWPFFATIPVLLFSSLGRDEDDPAHRRHPAPTTVAASTPVPAPVEDDVVVRQTRGA
ncbi:hypothetical protein [Luteococcus peritonei]|uniref:DUF2567 domain-containing protein n=1 Tax=Luteococcus peritonei TaxID=88874 RepID=A0ABW4RZE9_9ACTN